MNLIVLDTKQFYPQAAALFIDAANRAIAERGVFNVALSGGSTPKPLYALLAKEFSDSIKWAKARIFFSDERCVPPDDPESNYRMAYETLLSKVPIPPENVYRMRGEAKPEDAARDYADMLRNEFGLSNGEFPQFDLMLLGIGEDCHTASIFPESDAVENNTDLTAAVYVPKLDSQRLTLTPPVLIRSRLTVFLVSGEAKASAVKQAIEGPFDPKRCPAQLLRESEGEVVWMLDTDAGSPISDQ